MRTILLLGALTACLTARGYASTAYFVPGGTTDVGGNQVSAEVFLSLSLVGSTEVLTVILDNFSPNPVSDGENITGLKLNINSAQITGVSIASSNADLIQVPSKTSPPTDLGNGSLGHWTAATSVSQLTLTTIGSGQAIDSVIGAPAANGDYSNAGGSLTGSTKWPFANQTATFVLDLTGSNITLSSITGAQIGFGTLGTNYILAAPAPEPGTFWLLGAGGVVAGFMARRKRFTSGKPLPLGRGAVRVAL